MAKPEKIKPASEQNTVGYLTEDQLKEAAKRRREEQALIDALKKPVPPQQKKAENYWYHYKWHTIAGIVAVVLIAFFLKDIIFRTEPDATIIMATSKAYSTETIDALQSAIEQVIPDKNDDGKTLVTIDYIHFIPEPTQEEQSTEPSATDDSALDLNAMSGNMDYANTMKLTTVIAANLDPLYIIDDDLYRHFLSMTANEGDSDNSIFEPLNSIPGAQSDRLSLSSTVIKDAPGCEALADDLTFCLRLSFNDSEKKAAYHEYCRLVLQALAS